MDELEKLKRELVIAGKASDMIIVNMHKLLADAIKHERWSRAGELESYVFGCEQIKMVYEMAIKKSELQEK